MTRTARHIVRRVVLELDLGTPAAEAPRQQTRVADLCRRRLARLLDRCLTEYGDPDTLYRIDRLECIIPGIDLERLESEWTEKVEAGLRKALQEALHRAGPDRVADALFPGGPGPWLADDRDGALVGAAAFDLLTFFFRYGHLPWWASTADRPAISTALLEIAATQPDSNLPERLFQMTASDAVAQQRLFRHAGDAGLLAFCRRLAGGAELGAALAEIVTTASAQGLSWLNIRTRFWMEAWTALQIPGTWQDRLEMLLKILSADTVGGTLWKQVAVRLAAQYRFLPPFAPDGTASKGSAENRSSRDGMLHESEVPGSEGLRDKTKMKPSAPDASAAPRQDIPGQQDFRTTDRTRQVKDGAPSAPVLPSASRPPDFDASDQIYLENAGLVLLAPYLPRLWEQLGWTAGKQFTSSETAWLAVQMLQYLADGQDDPPEYLLILPKILCGFAPDALYAPPRALESAEKAEGEALLAAVLEHAPGLGLTTTGALRGSFLLRNGVLRSGGMQWLLHVEKETYDIVLQKVAWGFQAVKFPWMEVAVYVEWEV